jgi:hypothetical protein
MKGLNGPFPWFGRGIPLEYATFNALAFTVLFIPKSVPLGAAQK